jgi:hypothetical protein
MSGKNVAADGKTSVAFQLSERPHNLTDFCYAGLMVVRNYGDGRHVALIAPDMERLEFAWNDTKAGAPLDKDRVQRVLIFGDPRGAA